MLFILVISENDIELIPILNHTGVAVVLKAEKAEMPLVILQEALVTGEAMFG